MSRVLLCIKPHLNNNIPFKLFQVAWIKSDTKAILAIHDHVITNNDRLDVTHNDKVISNN